MGWGRGKEGAVPVRLATFTGHRREKGEGVSSGAAAHFHWLFQSGSSAPCETISKSWRIPMVISAPIRVGLSIRRFQNRFEGGRETE